MPLNELQRANFRHHTHLSDQVVDPDTGDPIEPGGGVSLPIAESDVTNLVSDLAGKASTSHGHFNSIACGAQAAIFASAATTNSPNDGSIGQYSGSFATKNLMQFSLSGVSAVKKAWLQIVVGNFNNCLGINEGVGAFLRAERIIRTDVNYSQVTWNVYKTGSNWGTAGANDATDRSTDNTAYDGPFDDSSTIPFRRVPVLTGATVQMEQFDITGMLQQAVALSQTNLDIALAASQTGGQNAFVLYNRVDTPSAYRPQIVWV